MPLRPREEELGDQAGDGGEEEGCGEADEGEFPAQDADFHGDSADGPEGPSCQEGHHGSHARAGAKQAGGDGQADVGAAGGEAAGDGADEYSLHARFGSDPFREEFMGEQDLDHSRDNEGAEKQGKHLSRHGEGEFHPADVCAAAFDVSDDEEYRCEDRHYDCGDQHGLFSPSGLH